MLCNAGNRATEAFPDRGLISLRNPKASESEMPKEFSFDAVFGANVEQKFIYDTCAASVIESVLNGYNGTIFAYGQVRAESLQGYNDRCMTLMSDGRLCCVSLSMQTGSGKVRGVHWLLIV